MNLYIINSLKDLPKTKIENSLIITNSYEVSSYAIKNNIKFKEFSEIVNFEECSKTNVHDYFTNWFDLKNDAQEYFYSLKYSLSNQIKSIEFAKLFSESLCSNYNFDKVFLTHNLSPSFKRENINNFQTKLISFFLVLKKKKVVNLGKTHRVKEILHTVFFKYLPYLTKFYFATELILNYSKYLTQKTNNISKSNYDLLSFSAGTDSMYISNIVNKINTHSTLNIQSQSIHYSNSLNFKNSIQIDFFYLKNILKIKQFIKIKRLEIIILLSNNDPRITSFFSKNAYLINYIFFRILREGLQINLYKNIIKKFQPKAVISGSLYLPLIAANSLNIKTISVIEGLGIVENPVSPHHGKNILSPNQFSVNQIKNQYDNKSYHIVGHEIFQKKFK